MTLTEKFTSGMLNDQIICTNKEHELSAIERYKQNRKPINDYLEIVFPNHNTYFAIDPNISRERQLLEIDYIAKYEVEDVRIFIDDIEQNSFKWQLTKGIHKIDIRGYVNKIQVKDTIGITVL
ncbi:hypothetical protein HOH45_08780 [bacterium]|jgi:hypothetical protein|nr:hypothetical protein [bacterium]